MSAGVCGKRLGFEEIFGSPAPAKRSRCSRYGSPIGGFGSEDNLSFLLQMFPSMDREVVESILNSHNGNIDDAIKSLRVLCICDDPPRHESVSLNSNDNPAEGGMNCPEESRVDTSDIGPQVPENGSSWVDLFVQEMTSASNWDDVRGRATKFLEAFERRVLCQYPTLEKQQEIASLKEQVECLLRDNQILKRAVAIQHERSSEHEDKLKEVQQLKFVISQYQEQVRTLEMNNYALKVHLQRAQESNSIPSRFHPDIF